MKVTHFTVRDEHRDWGEFFVAEREPETGQDGHVRYTATWTCYSSFGVFGHHWYSMGSPFTNFIQGTNQDYVLGKIASREYDAEKTLKNVRRAILKSRRYNNCTKDEAREAIEDLERIKDECAESGWAALLYESVPISHCDIEWCDLETQSHPRDAVMFMQRIWPLFVARMREEVAVG